MEGISYIHSWEGIAEKRQKILELSQKTISYQFWISAQKEVKPVFDAFVRQQPEEIQTMLRNYVGICQMEDLIGFVTIHVHGWIVFWNLSVIVFCQSHTLSLLF